MSQIRDRTQSHRFRCPECDNRNECRMCVLSADVTQPARERRMFCDVCGTQAPAEEFVPEDKRAEPPEDLTEGLPDWSEVT